MKVFRYIVGLVVLCTAGIIFLFLLNPFDGEENASVQMNAAKEKQTTKSKEQQKKEPSKRVEPVRAGQSTNEQEGPVFSHEKVVTLAHKFMDMLVQNIDDNYKVLNYKSKKALLDAFEAIASRDTARTYVDFYYEEKEDGLYIIPTETPPWFDEHTPYDMVQLDPETFRVIQENQSDLYGPYKIEMEFTFDDGWKISAVVHS